MHSSFFLAVLAFAGMVLPLWGNPTVMVSLDGVSARIRSDNPDLAAARLRIQEALGRMKQSGRLSNPEVETILENNTRFREGRLQVEFSQRFPVTQRLRLEKEISLTELKASEAEVREVERQLIASARGVVVKLLANRQQRELLQAQAANAAEMARSLTETAGRGEGSAMDAMQAKLEASGLEIESARLTARETELNGELRSLLGMRPTERLAVSGTLPEPVLPTWKKNPLRRPDLEVATLQAAAAAQEVALEQSRRYDDVEGGLFAAVDRSEDAPNGYDNERIIGLRLKIPLPLWNQNEGAIEQARAKQQRHELETTALARTIRQDADTARAEMKQWAVLVNQISSELLPLADQQIQLAKTLYQNGGGDFQSVLRSRAKRLQLASARIDALSAFHAARVRYESIFTHP